MEELEKAVAGITLPNSPTVLVRKYLPKKNTGASFPVFLYTLLYNYGAYSKGFHNLSP